MPLAPPFYWLQGAVGLGAFILADMILITENRLARNAERRSQLDLQISLLSEQKITKVNDMLDRLSKADPPP